MISPEMIRQELFVVGKELGKAADAIYKLETAAEQAELDYQKQFDVAFLSGDGSIEDRKAFARGQAEQAHEGLIVARAAYNRGKMKAKHLELEQMRLMAVLKSIQAEGA